MNVESSEVGPSSAPLILMFDAHRTFRRGGQSWMLAPTGLNAGLLVSRDDKFIAFERFAFPAAFIKIEDSVGLDSEAGVSGEDPTAVVPGANGVFMEPPPNGASGDGGNQAGIADLAGNVRSVPVGKGNAMGGGQLASQRLNLNDQFWGKKPGDDPGGSARLDRPDALRRSAFATCSQLRDGCQGERRFDHWRGPRRQEEPSWRVGPQNTATYISRPGGAVRVLLARTGL